MSKRIDRAVHGPSWTEVVVGAVLSLLLGIVLAIVLLVFKPVMVSRVVPKEGERDPRAVYYIEGQHTGSRRAEALAKRKAFLDGQSVTIGEDEINALVAAGTTPTPAEAGQPKGATARNDALAVGMVNFRIRDGVMQVGAPVQVRVLGLDQRIIVQARGGFAKSGDVFVFSPSELYLGSCPVQNLPFLARYVRNQFVAAQPIPADLAAAWGKLADVAIEGDVLKLTMP
jgi:hypothetical protein